jgi:surfactin synthase thioesterase subunit
MKLIIFPHAGGFASYYHEMAEKIDSEVIVFEYSGRGRRASRESYSDFEELICDAVEKLSEYFLKDGEDYCLFGHSMGAYAAIETAFRMQYYYDYPPKCVFISGQSSPYYEKNQYTEKSDEELSQYLISLGGLRSESMEMYLKQLLPIIRLDMRLLDGYRYREKSLPYNGSLYLMYGEADEEIRKEELCSWKGIAAGETYVRAYSGGHFYFKNELDDVCDYISRCVS